MSVHVHRKGWVYTTAVSWRLIAQRFSFIFFLVLALGFLVMGRSRPVVIEEMRTRVLDGLTPVLDVMGRPMAMIENASLRVADFFRMQVEIERLRSENASLLQWQNTSAALAHENRELRALLNYKPEPSAAYISARVIADTGGPYVRTLVVTAGHDDGVREGMAAMTGEGLVGRVIEVGAWSSRILLITDLNSRIPVIVAETGEHAVLAGNNEPQPKLLYLPQDAVVRPGSRVLTSGHGGVFPPGLPVGIVKSTARGEIVIEPLAAMGRINQVRLVDFNLKGGSFNPMTDKIEAAAGHP